ncbi:unnamed protein product [Schistocephalus solidus]|uniref:Uncharacterized protein n=1 Tax=Schistocephalus solidus TaxID=70667 RepID=A0A183SKE4_SCHSO|nr:unnamed protein product [Schistocephalus solidus]
MILFLPFRTLIDSLMVSHDSIEVVAVEIWGALRALETLSQLIWCYPNSEMAFINRTFIDDRPRFPHRGIMLDTSRHYLSKRVIMANLAVYYPSPFYSLMSYNASSGSPIPFSLFTSDIPDPTGYSIIFFAHFVFIRRDPVQGAGSRDI